ncbi:tRNA modifying enzyme [Micractinium conductrix]|uniref:tRNA modifying enzyme n=1 Tax=Micractinium conductrix TaxID=554055 RepID=A0A2P6V1G6_9CHLO|nr:tRNA modifying enzyme [Micractinium conductrix]|eukprot:PSC67925.1 tRNA modifying enzyme [Micractinium conductrix]
MDRRDGKGLAQLLHELGKLEGLRWIRLLYCYPSYFSEDLIDEIANNPKPAPIPPPQVCKYIDIPLQHIANMTLLGMNRPPQAHTLALLHKLRERIPALALRTTFISGFPGEAEAEHRELVDFCSTFKFERMGCFQYSEEDGTPAAELPEQLPAEVREARRDELISLQQRVGEEWAKTHVGQELEVLVDGFTEDGEIYGRTQWDAPDIDPIVFLTMDDGSPLAPLDVGQLRRCRVVGTSLFDLEAVPVE